MKVTISGDGAEILAAAVEALALDCGHNVEIIVGDRVLDRQPVNARPAEALAKAKAAFDRLTSTTIIILVESETPHVGS